jgi:hypothetical protein
MYEARSRKARNCKVLTLQYSRRLALLVNGVVVAAPKPDGHSRGLHIIDNIWLQGQVRRGEQLAKFLTLQNAGRPAVPVDGVVVADPNRTASRRVTFSQQRLATSPSSES